MASSPNLSEIATTTLRSRSAKQKKDTHMLKKPVKRSYEGSSADIKADKKGAKKEGMPVSEYENSPADRRNDIRDTIAKAIQSSKKVKAVKVKFK
jgi:hypothetical protein